MTTEPLKPFLFLDVDGVIAPFGDRPEWPKQFVGVASVPIVSENRERLAALDEAFEIVWCTDWMVHANELGAIYGLTPRPYLEIPEGRDGDTAHYEVEGEDGLPLWHHDPFTRPEDLKWDRSYGSPSMVRKLPALSAFLNARDNQGRPFAWVDDHVNFEARRLAFDWPHETLLVRTNRESGLTEAEFDELLNFTAQLVRANQQVICFDPDLKFP